MRSIRLTLRITGRRETDSQHALQTHKQPGCTDCLAGRRFGASAWFDSVMSRKTVIKDGWAMLREGLVPEDHKKMVIAELKFLESLSPRSSRALDRCKWAEREAHAKASPERLAQMVVTRWGDFLSAMQDRRAAIERNSETRSSPSSGGDYINRAPAESRCPWCRRRLDGYVRPTNLRQKKSNPTGRRSYAISPNAKRTDERHPNTARILS